MKKLFFKLYGALALAIIVFIAGVSFLPEYLLRNTIAQESQRVTKGTFYLLQQELLPLPKVQWQNQIEQLQPHFGYPLQLKRFDELTLKNWELENLQQGMAVVSRFDHAEHWYQRVGESNYVLVVGMEETRDVHAERLAQGSFYLALKRLAGQPVEQWAEIVQSLQNVFGFPIGIIDLNETGLDETLQARLQQGHVVGVDIDKRSEHYYQRIDDRDYVLHAGPVGHPLIFELMNIVIWSCFALLIALVIFLWVKPLWRDVSQLSQATAAFGRGEFEVRADVSRRSSLAILAETFNGMAERIQGLINSHKELTNAVSHELRTPIARLRFGLEMAQNATDDASRGRYLKGMGTDIEELDALVAELLTYARFDRDTPDLKLTRQALLPWLNEVIERASLGSNGIVIQVHNENLPDNSVAMFEPRLMARALINLLQNARRYANKRIDVWLLVQDGEYQLVVDDDGPGVSKAERDKIFDPFTRLDVSRDRGTGGYGLGLAIVQRIAGWHQGQVSVTDSPKGGARFVIQWPQTL